MEKFNHMVKVRREKTTSLFLLNVHFFTHTIVLKLTECMHVHFRIYCKKKNSLTGQGDK